MEIDNKTFDDIKVDYKKVQNEKFGASFSDKSHCSAELKEICVALTTAQAEMGIPILKGKACNVLEDFDSIVKASRVALIKNGLVVTQLILRNDDGYKILRTVLLHKSGQWISAYDSFSDPDWEERDPLQYLTFLRMQSYVLIVGLVIIN